MAYKVKNQWIKIDKEFWGNKRDKFRKVLIYKRTDGWAFQTGGFGLENYKRKVFKTKSEALAYAKEYMKKH